MTTSQGNYPVGAANDPKAPFNISEISNIYDLISKTECCFSSRYRNTSKGVVCLCCNSITELELESEEDFHHRVLQEELDRY